MADGFLTGDRLAAGRLAWGFWRACVGWADRDTGRDAPCDLVVRALERAAVVFAMAATLAAQAPLAP